MQTLKERAEKLANDLRFGHYNMATAIAMIRELAEALNTRPAAPVEGLECQTCNGTGNEGRGLICRDCDEPKPPIELVRYLLDNRPNYDHDGNPYSDPIMAPHRQGEYVRFEQAEAIIAAERRNTAEAIREGLKAVGELKADNARLRDSSAPMACDPDQWTAAEEILAHLLISVIGVPDDVTYTPDQAQGIIVKSIKALEAHDAIIRSHLTTIAALNTHNAAMAAQYKDLEDYAREATKAITGLTGGGSENFSKQIGELFTADLPLCLERIRERYVSKVEVKLLETQLAAARKALEDIAHPKALTSLSRDKARAALEGKPCK